VLILSGVLLVGGKTFAAMIGLLICATACAAIYFFAPWRHRRTPYRRLLLPIYALFFSAVGWGVWALGDPRLLGIHGWGALLLLIPLTIPMWTVGNRRWEDHDA